MTELIWDGKYDKSGRRVAPLRVALPFRTAEMVGAFGQAATRPTSAAPCFMESARTV